VPDGSETNDCDEDPAVAANARLATSRRGDGGGGQEPEAEQGLSRPGIMTGHVESGANTRAADSANAPADKGRSRRLSSAVDGSSAKGGAADARHAGADGSTVASVPACRAEVPAVDGGGADRKADSRVSHDASGGMGRVRKDANVAVGASGGGRELHAGTSTAGGSRGQLGEEQQPAQAPAVGKGEEEAEAMVTAVTATASVPTGGDGEEKRGGADRQGGLSDGEDEDLPDIVLASPDESDDSE
jgi:hypothetical protein